MALRDVVRQSLRRRVDATVREIVEDALAERPLVKPGAIEAIRDELAAPVASPVDGVAADVAALTADVAALTKSFQATTGELTATKQAVAQAVDAARDARERARRAHERAEAAERALADLQRS